MVRKIILRLIVLALILCGLNLIYTLTFYKADLHDKCREIIELNNSLPNTDIYYFGESSNVTYQQGDSTQKTISELTSLFYPGLRLTNINKYATHGGIYWHWLKQMDLSKGSPRAIVVTLNLRSFDATWINSKLETQLQESIVFTKPYPNLVNRFFLSLQAFDNKTEKQREKEVAEEWAKTKLRFPFEFRYKTVKEWDDGMAAGGYLKPDGTWDMDKIVLACHYIKGFAFNLDENNARVRDFDAITQWCSENKISLYLNLMAENLDYADSLVGKELVYLMSENRNYLVNRYNKGTCTVVDNLGMVEGKAFIDQNWTSEHYNYKGRMLIAKRLAKALKNQFETNYKEAY